MPAAIVLYVVINRISNRIIYVGQTNDGPRRWGRHRSDAHGMPSQGSLAHEIKAVGEENFEFIIVDRANTRESANNLERQLIARHGTITPNGFNRTTGGGWDFALTENFSSRKRADSLAVWQRPEFRISRGKIAKLAGQRAARTKQTARKRATLPLVSR